MSNTADFTDINRAWGTRSHWRLQDRIMVAEECPRCTYQPHNEIFEEVIFNDSMTYKFV